MKKFVLLEIALIFIAPTILLYFNLLPTNDRVIILASYGFFVLLLIMQRHWSFKTVGLRVDNLKKVALPYFLFTLVCVVALVIVAQIVNKQPFDGWYRDYRLLILFLPNSIIQEFVYRSFLMHELVRLKLSVFLMILVNTILFTLPHGLWGNWSIVMPLSFFSGIGFALMYYRYPNLIAISLSHAVLNLTAVIYTFF